MAGGPSDRGTEDQELSCGTFHSPEAEQIRRTLWGQRRNQDSEVSWKPSEENISG